MLWVFVLALIMPISLGSCDDVNLAKVTWAHAVNSHDALKNALTDDKIQMIEADVLLGELVMPSLAVASTNAEDVKQPKGKTAKKEGDETPAATDDATADADEAAAEPDQEAPHGDTDTDTGSNKGGSQQVNQIPIMAHPPASSSDLSLDQFLQEVAEHNKNTTSPKGVKLDFKSIDALKAWKPKDVGNNLWINADILTGPNKQTGDEVNAKEFFATVAASKELKNKTLSIGWTTALAADDKGDKGYTKAHIDAMIKTLTDNKVDAGYPITFPVRAALAAESKDTLRSLYDEVSKTYQVTFTIWSGDKETEKVNNEKLQEFIDTFGLNKVYVDVPEDLMKKLNSGASTVVKFGLVNLAAIAFAMFFRNGLH